MIYTGIDYHKRYSVACTLDAQGHRLHEARIDGNAAAAFAAYFKHLGTPSEVVIEACWNWGVLYDLLEDTPGVAKVVLSHPAKNRIIAEAQIKNDGIDAHALATLLRGDFVAKVHVPSRDVRQRKNVVRQRLWLARLRTMIRNRIHCVIDRHPQLERPAVKDVFCHQGKAWMKRAPLPAADRKLLDDSLSTGSVSGNASPVSAARDEKGWTLTLDVPGVTKEHVSIGIEGQVVRIETLADAPRPYKQAYEFPQEIDATASEAKLENGVLTLKLARKSPVSHTTRIPVN
jgi:HSP20 family protein